MRIDMLPIVTLALLGMASASRHVRLLDHENCRNFSCFKTSFNIKKESTIPESSIIKKPLLHISQLSQLACGPTPNSTSVPQNALLYLSLRATGTINYVCNASNQSTNGFTEQATLSNAGYTGRIFLNALYHSHGLNNVLQFDVGILSVSIDSRSNGFLRDL